jgi:ABC-type sulfate transport system permease subunit
MRWALIYGVVLSSARALGEFGAVSIVSGNVVGQTQALPLYVEDQFNNFDLSAAYSAGLLLAVISVLIPDRDDLAHPRMPQGIRMSIQAAAISKFFGDFRALSDVTVTTPPAS